MMRKLTLAFTLFTLALPATGRAMQSERERERERERREQEREREQERREREAERRAEQRERERDQQQDARLDTTVAFGKGGIVDLTLISGDIVVRTWARPEVQVRASLHRGTILSELGNSRVTLTARSIRGRAGEGRYELQVPVGTRVVARGTSADILVNGVQAAVEARSTSGDIVVDGAADRITIESVSGDVNGRALAGAVHASAVSGDVELDQVTGELSASTVSGDITLSRVVSRDVRIETVSGEVQYDGSVERTGRYEFHTHSGNIAFGIPEGTGASLSLATFSGEIETDYPVTIQPQQLNANTRRGGTRRLETTLSGGGARIIAETFSGNITIEKSIKR